VTYEVHFVVDLTALPQEVRAEMRRTMSRVADAVSTVPPANPFWASIHTSVLQIDVAGYRLLYRILPRSAEIHVVEVEPLAGRAC
jgi:hypothetical protein